MTCGNVAQLSYTKIITNNISHGSGEYDFEVAYDTDRAIFSVYDTYRLVSRINPLDGILLGDSGYACRSYLLTSVLKPETESEVRYNIAHKKTRVIVEQLFGSWKRRFPCLYYGLRTKLSTSVAIICATAVLHNVCIKHNLGEIIEEEFNEPIFENIVNEQQDGIGLAHKNAFILRHFS